MLEDPNMTSKLEYPRKTERDLRHRCTACCIFHQAHMHDAMKCQTLTHQLIVLVEKGFLKKYLQIRYKGEGTRTTALKGHDHESPILGYFNTIVGGFSGGGIMTTSQKRYSRVIPTLSFCLPTWTMFSFTEMIPLS